MTWGIPVSIREEAELFSGFTSEDARGLLNPCISRNGKPLAGDPHERDEIYSQVQLSSRSLFPSCSDIKPEDFRESENFFISRA